MNIFSPTEEKILIEDIFKNYFDKNFGSMSKVDFETMLFSHYIEHCLNSNEDISDYALSKKLGITQNKIRVLKERKELKYPRSDFKWQEALAGEIKNAKITKGDNYIKFIIQDINVLNEARHYIETHGWYDECSLNKKLFVIPLDCFIELFMDADNIDIPKATKKELEEKYKDDSTIVDFMKDTTKEGLKNFVMKASKTAIKNVLSTICPMGSLFGTAIKGLIDIIND